MTPAESLYEDLGQRIKHAASLVIFARTEMGNHVLIESSNVSLSDLTAAKKAIQDAITERKLRSNI